MFSEEQPNQNPEQVKSEKIQEEKSEKLSKPKKATTKSGKKAEITKKEKGKLIDLLHDRKSELNKTVAKKKAVSKQLSGKEKKAIKKLLEDKPEVKDSETVTERVEETETPKDSSQISQSERNRIVLLLHDRMDEKQEGVAEFDEDIDYEHLNKQELVEVLEEVVQEKDISKIRQIVGKIKTAFHHQNKEEKDKELQDFIAGGGNPEEYKNVEDPLEKRYNAAFGLYRHNKANFAQEIERQKQENLKLKYSILEDLKELIASEETLKKTYDEFKVLQDRWKEIGMVPAGELNNLWQNYHFLVEKFFDKVRINKELRDLDLRKNLESKIELCGKAEELLLEKSIITSFKLLQKYHDQWREIGPVPLENKDELWERFKAASDKINHRRKEHYKGLQEEQQNNYNAKVALCEKAEEILVDTDDNFKTWQKKTDQINELFKVWKTIGRAPRAKNDEIWARFRGTMDTFFNNRRAYLNTLKEQQTNNLNLKIDLCVKAEAVKESSDWRKTTQELINLQKEWKNIGPVPRRQSEKVWKRFRSACDEFFNRKSAFFKNIHGVEADNLKAKKALIATILEYKMAKDKKENLEALKKFQRDWMDLGHVPYKDKDRVQNEYRAAIDQLIDKMDINKLELTKSGFKDKIEIMKNDPDANWRLSKERGGISNKIKTLSDDIALWENNITFFASSKQSEKLKKDFEKKIDKAKSELKALEAKLKIIDES